MTWKTLAVLFLCAGITAGCGVMGLGARAPGTPGPGTPVPGTSSNGAHVDGMLAAPVALPGDMAPPVTRTYPVGQPHVGVMDSVAFRLSDAPGDTWTAMGAPHALAPLSFSDQITVMGFTAFHLRVVSDPDGTRYDRLRRHDRVELHQPGLKVVGRYGLDPEAECVTLMLCIMRLAALAAERPEHPVVVILEPFSPKPRDMVRRWRDPVPGFITKWVPRSQPPPPPRLDVIAREIAYVAPHHARGEDLSANSGGRLVIMVAATGAAPDDAPFLTPGKPGQGLQILPGRGAPQWVLERSRDTAEIVVVLDADWAGAGDPSQISALEAAAARADVVMLSHAAGR